VTDHSHRAVLTARKLLIPLLVSVMLAQLLLASVAGADSSGSTFSGTVLDASGVPVTGADLSLFAYSGDVGPLYQTTLSDGSFAFTGLPSEEFTLRLDISGPTSFLPAGSSSDMVFDIPDISSDLIAQTITMPAPVTYGVAVTGPDGNPVEGAAALFSGSCDESSFMASTSFPATPLGGDLQIFSTLQSDATGAASAPMLPCNDNPSNGVVTGKVNPPATSAGSLMLPTTNISLPLPAVPGPVVTPVALQARTAPVAFSGVLSDATGNGVAGVQLELEETSPYVVWQTVTQSDGSFAFNVPPGNYELKFTYQQALTSADGSQLGDAGISFEVDDIVLATSEVNQTLVLPPLVQEVFQVTDPNGQPVAGTSIADEFGACDFPPLDSSIGTPSGGLGTAAFAGVTDSTGAMEFQTIPCDWEAGGSVSVVNIDPPLDTGLVDAQIDAPDLVGGEEDVQLQAGVLYSGIVNTVNSGGAPYMQVTATGDAGTFSTNTDSGDSFAMNLPVGVYDVTLTSTRGGYRPLAWSGGQQPAWTINDVDLTAGPLTEQVITLPEISEIEVSIESSDGSPASAYTDISMASCHLPAVTSTSGSPSPGPVVTQSGGSSTGSGGPSTASQMSFWRCADDATAPEISVTAYPEDQLDYLTTSAEFPSDYSGVQDVTVQLTDVPPTVLNEFSFCMNIGSFTSVGYSTASVVLQSRTTAARFSPTQDYPSGGDEECYDFFVPPDQYDLSVSYTDWTNGVPGGSAQVNFGIPDIDLSQGSVTGVDFTVPTRQISFAVSDTNANPIPGAQVSLSYNCPMSLDTQFGPAEVNGSETGVTVSSDSNGMASFPVFSCDSLHQASAQVAAPSTTNFGSEVISFGSPWSDGQTIPIDLASVQGTVVDSSDAALGGQQLGLYNSNGTLAASSTTDSSGDLALSVDPGDYAAVLSGSVGDPVTYDVSIPSLDLHVHQSGTFTLPTKALQMDVTDPSGAPVSGATVTVNSSPTSFTFLGAVASGTESGSETTNASGVATLEVLPSAGLSLTITPPSGTLLRPSSLTVVPSGGAVLPVSLPSANTAPPLITGTAQDGKTLSATQGKWSSPDTLTYAYQWERCSPTGQGCKAIGGAISHSYKLSSADVGDKVTAVVTATDGANSAASSAAPVGPVADPRAPLATAPPSITGTAQDGKTLSATVGSWSSADTLTHSYKWELCNPSGQGCAPIAGATARSYKLTAPDVGDEVTVLVSATDKEAQTGQATATPVGPVADPPAPADTAAPVITGTPRAGQELRAGHGSWSSPDALTYSYQWERCNGSGQDCKAIVGATHAYYMARSADLGDEVTVVVTATDKEGQTGQATATPVGPVTKVAASLRAAHGYPSRARLL